MSGFVWAKFLMLAQLDVLAVFGWVVVALFGVATMVMYLGAWTAPSAAGHLGSLTWVPLPADLKIGEHVDPYGAVTLKRIYQRNMATGTIIAALGMALFVGGGVGIQKLLAKEQKFVKARVVSYAELGAPPSLSQKEAPATGVNVGPPPPPPPSAAIPIPVPDQFAPKNTTILSQEELGDLGPTAPGGETSIWGGGGGGGFGGGGGVSVEGDDDPNPGDFQPVEELPQLVTMPAPVYPAMAREAQLEGVVKLMVLVGKDGKVKNVKVEQSIQMLDDAARDAALQAVFKPATWQKKPVAVWVSVPIRFTLRAE